MEWADLKLMLGGRQIKISPSNVDFGEGGFFIAKVTANKDELRTFFDHVLDSKPPVFTLDWGDEGKEDHLVSRFEVAFDTEIKDKYYIKFYGRECDKDIKDIN